MIYWISYWLVRLTDWIYFHTVFQGREFLPKKTSYIIASNHISNVDPFVLGISRVRRFSYVAKESLFKSSLSAFYFHHVGAIPIKRDTSDFRAIREILKRIKNGCPVILFPEGTRGAGDREKKIQPGVGLIALKAGVPVIPAYIEGSDKGLPPGAKWFKKHPIRVRFGSPLHFDRGQTYQEIAEKIMLEIYALSNG